MKQDDGTIRGPLLERQFGTLWGMLSVLKAQNRANPFASFSGETHKRENAPGVEPANIWAIDGQWASAFGPMSIKNDRSKEVLSMILCVRALCMTTRFYLLPSSMHAKNFSGKLPEQMAKASLDQLIESKLPRR